VHSVLDVQLTDLLLVVPNLMAVAVLPRAKPTPVTVTLVPPDLGPVFGFTPVSTNCGSGKNPMEPTGIEPVTSCLQSPSDGGRLRVMCRAQRANAPPRLDSADLCGSDPGG
jgi:hypothetical protein